MKIRDAVLRMGAYKPPLEGRNPEDYVLMDFNESPVPPHPAVVDALVDYLRGNTLQVYPAYGDFLDLLAAYAGVPAEWLILTNGSDQGIEIVMRMVLDPGDEVVMAKPGFAMFNQVAGVIGAEMVQPEYGPDMAFPFAAVAAAVGPRTRLVVVINPNNPTGTSATREQLVALLERFPDVGLLVDEAYYEFTGNTCADLVARHPNLMVLRTFSKAFAIPSLRLGYVVARGDVVEHLHKIRGPYDVNMLALRAARAQLERPDYWRGVVAEVMGRAKPELEAFFEAEGVRFWRGDANFMLVRPADRDGAVAHLKAAGVLVRPMKPPIADTFRVSVGTVDQTRRFIAAYRGWLAVERAAPAGRPAD